MAEGWMRAIAEVFVEVRLDSESVDNVRRERHLVAVSESSATGMHQQSAIRGPELVIVSLLGGPTRAELKTSLEAAAHAAHVIAARSGTQTSRVVVLGMTALRPGRRRARAEFEYVDSGTELRTALARSPQVLVADAAGFHDVPDSFLSGSVIVALDREGDGSEYAQLFVNDAAARLPDAIVSASSIQSLAAPRSNARSAARALGGDLLQIVEANLRIVETRS